MDLKIGKDKLNGHTFLSPSNIVLPAAIGNGFSSYAYEESFPNFPFWFQSFFLFSYCIVIRSFEIHFSKRVGPKLLNFLLEH